MIKGKTIITLLTDFGLDDEYVGVMKGVILSINPCSHVIDITHNISRHNVVHGAYTVDSYFRYFPSGSIHVCVIDPGVGGRRRVIALRCDGHIFLAPDNGLLSIVIEKGKVEELYNVVNEGYFLSPVSNTFHGRDIFAPVAAYISRGVPLDSFGERIDIDQLKKLDIERPYISEHGELIGVIISIDRFGNLITNIDKSIFEGFLKSSGREVKVQIAGVTIDGIKRSYDSVNRGKPLAIFGSRNLLEISVNKGSAREFFKVKTDERVKVVRDRLRNGTE
nr:hypothetical protein [Desulfobacterales bacterium]